MRLACLLALLGSMAACSEHSDVSRTLGARCDQASECDDRCLAPSDDWPGGFCTLTCATDQDCPDDALCVDEDSGGVCAFSCADDRGCAFLGGYACTERPRNVDDTPVLVCRG